MQKKKLILGGFGFLGSSVAKALVDDGCSIKILDQYESGLFRKNNARIELVVGSINDDNALSEALTSVDTVLYFASHSYPGMKHASIQFEIDNTLRSLDIVMKKMRDAGVTKILFPSSGGTIYGEVMDKANETQSPQPMSVYGAGKLLCEETIKFYCRAYGFDALILRISNVYGCPFFRKVQQGAIDIFIQKALTDEAIELWGNPSLLIRDHIFIDDFCNATLALLKLPLRGAEIFNVATGVGRSLQDVIDCIEVNIGKSLIKHRLSNNAAGVSKSVLDNKKIKEHTGWSPKYSLESGIQKTIKTKEMAI